MKVKITQSVLYEDVPDIIQNLLGKCRSQLRKSSEFEFNMLKLSETAAEISRIQNALDLVSSQLEDCYHMSQGYLQVRQQLLEQQLQQQQADSWQEEDEQQQEEDEQQDE